MNWLKQLVSKIGLLGMVMFAGVALPPRPAPPVPVVPAPTQVAAIELTVLGYRTQTLHRGLKSSGWRVTARG